MGRRTVYIVFDLAQSDLAEEISQWVGGLTSAVEMERRTGYFKFELGKEIVSDSAIILLSDEAVRNPQWQIDARGFKDDVRLIPVGKLVDADYSDPDIVPNRIEEINFIQVDENVFDSIFESLTLPLDFFQMRNRLLGSMNAWVFSNYSESLLYPDSVKGLKSKISVIQDRLDRETDGFFARQLRDILDYLKLSLSRARAFRRAKALKYFARGMLLVLAAVVVAAAVWGIPNMRRAYNATTLLTNGAAGIDEEILAVRCIDAIENPFISDSDILGEFSTRINEALDENWSNSTLNTALNCNQYDIVLDSSCHKAYTAAGDGHIAVWDYYTGEQTGSIEISGAELLCLDCIPEKGVFAACDADGVFHVVLPSGEKLEASVGIDGFTAEDISISRDARICAVSGSTSSGGYGFVFSIGIDGLDVLTEVFSQRVLACNVVDDGTVLLSLIDNGSLDVFAYNPSGAEQLVVVDDDPGNLACCCFQFGTLVYASKGKEVKEWSWTNPNETNGTGLRLDEPISVELVDASTIVYNERSIGVRLYDTRYHLDLGSCFDETPVMSKLYAGNGVVAGRDFCALFYVEEIFDLLPIESIEELGVVRVIDGTFDKGDCGSFKSAYIEEGGLLVANAVTNEKNITVLFDDSGYENTRAARDEGSSLERLPEGYYVPNYDQFDYVGMPTVVGIVCDGNGMVFGTEDGHVYETILRDGKISFGCSKIQVPSHAPIEEICVCGTCYLVKDSMGLYWKKRIGCLVFSYEDYKTAVRNKLRAAVSSELIDEVSSRTASELGLVAMQESAR